jgi:hypothetical protein
VGLVLAATVGAAVTGLVGSAGLDAGADTTLLGYNASALAIGSQYAFNVPGLVPLPNENLIEEDVPFARTSVGAGPVIDALAAPYYPGDIAADLGSLLQTFGAPPLPLNDTLLAESKYPTSPGYPSHAAFDEPPTGTSPTVFSSSADSSSSGGDATGTLSDLALVDLTSLPALPGVPTTNTDSLLDVGNISSTNDISLGASSITSTATAQIKTLDIAGLIDVTDLASTATATSNGSNGTPTATLHLGQVTVDGQNAYIDNTGVHVVGGTAPLAGITPAQLQQTVDTTLSQDGISVRVLDPKLTTTGAQASADAGGLVVSISHQFDVPFVPGEPTIPVPELGNVGLPAGVYTATTSVTFGLAQATATASGVVSATGGSGAAPTTAATTPGTSPATVGALGNTGNTGFGTSVQSLGTVTGAGNSSGTPGQESSPATAPPALTSFPIPGVPPPVGWTVVVLLACLLMAYPLLLLARWQFPAVRRR